MADPAQKPGERGFIYFPGFGLCRPFETSWTIDRKAVSLADARICKEALTAQEAWAAYFGINQEGEALSPEFRRAVADRIPSREFVSTYVDTHDGTIVMRPEAVVKKRGLLRNRWAAEGGEVFSLEQYPIAENDGWATEYSPVTGLGTCTIDISNAEAVVAGLARYLQGIAARNPAPDERNSDETSVAQNLMKIARRSISRQMALPEKDGLYIVRVSHTRRNGQYVIGFHEISQNDADTGYRHSKRM